MKRRNDEIVYRTNIFSRVLMFFFYYWWGCTLLLFLPLFVFGVFSFGYDFLTSYWNAAILKSSINWEMLLASVSFIFLTWWASASIWKGFKDILHPVTLIEGIIKDKKEVVDEGTSYYVYLKSGEKKEVEVNEKTYNKLHIGNRVKIVYSNKLDQALKIIRV